MTITEQAARDSMVAAGVRLGSRGLIVAAEGNLSIRLDEGILITPSGSRKDMLAPGDLVLVPFEPPVDDGAANGFDGAPAGPRPSSNIGMHRAIYAARPDVRAIAHAHLVAAIALTLVNVQPDPNILPETSLHLPRLPVVPFAEAASDALARMLVTTLTDGRDPADYPNAVLLERHGAIAIGPDLGVAIDRLELTDLLCRVQRDTILLRSAVRNSGV